MSLEQAIVNLTAEVKRLNDRAEATAKTTVVVDAETTKPAAVAAKPAAKPAAKKAAPKVEEAAPVVAARSLAQVQEDGLKIVASKELGGRDKIVAILAPYGVKRLAELDEASLAEVDAVIVGILSAEPTEV